jgi:hypothetical protein
MNFLQNLFARSLLAFALAASAGAALAGPTYHVNVDTNKYADLGIGGFQLTFLTQGGQTDPLTATVSGLSGAFLDTPELTNVGTDNGVLTFSNDSFSEFFQLITLGGLFSFDVSFDGIPGGAGGTSLNVGLYGPLDVLELNAVNISLAAGEPISVVNGESGSATAVPEPSTLLSLFTGFGLLGFTLRRRVR